MSLQFPLDPSNTAPLRKTDSGRRTFASAVTCRLLVLYTISSGILTLKTNCNSGVGECMTVARYSRARVNIISRDDHAAPTSSAKSIGDPPFYCQDFTQANPAIDSDDGKFEVSSVQEGISHAIRETLWDTVLDKMLPIDKIISHLISRRK